MRRGLVDGRLDRRHVIGNAIALGMKLQKGIAALVTS